MAQKDKEFQDKNKLVFFIDIKNLLQIKSILLTLTVCLQNIFGAYLFNYILSEFMFNNDSLFTLNNNISKQMQQIPTSKTILKKQIKQIMEMLRSLPTCPETNTLISQFQLFAEKSVQKDTCYDLLKQQCQTLKLKYDKKQKELKKISKENHSLKKTIQNQIKEISRLDFNKKGKNNKNSYKEGRPNNMFDYDLMFQRGKSQNWAVQTDRYQDLLAAYQLKIQKLEIENRQLKDTVEHCKNQYHQKINENECLKEFLNRYMEDLKIGSDNDEKESQDMIQRSQTISELADCQSYCSESMMEKTEEEIDEPNGKNETVEPIETNELFEASPLNNETEKVQKIIQQNPMTWWLFEKMLGFWRILKQ